MDALRREALSLGLRLRDRSSQAVDKKLNSL
jgi:hypothetical protein